jgi:hypothetical protein
MRKLFDSIVLFLLSASLAFSVQRSANWIIYNSPEGHYVVSLPHQPKVTTQESTTADGEKFPQHLASVVEADGVVFLVGYFDVLPGTIFSADVARDSMVKSVSGRLIKDSAISLGEYPGHDLHIALKFPAATPAVEPASEVEYYDRARIYEAGKRIYILQVVFPRALDSDALTARVEKYFDSFQLVKN